MYKHFEYYFYKIILRKLGLMKIVRPFANKVISYYV